MLANGRNGISGVAAPRSGLRATEKMFEEVLRLKPRRTWKKERSFFKILSTQRKKQKEERAERGPTADWSRGRLRSFRCRRSSEEKNKRTFLV